MKKVLILFVLAFITMACKKEKLVDEKEVLIGTWGWTHTAHTHNKCDYCCYEYDTIYANISEDTYKINFLKKGKLEFYKNNVLTDSKRIVFKHFTPLDSNAYPNGYSFSIYLNNKKDEEDISNLFFGRVLGDDNIIMTYSYPFITHLDNPCEDYRNYFIKE